MATAYLSRTAGTPTNSKKWTLSTWVKSAWGGTSTTGNEGTLIGTRVDVNNYEFVGFDSVPRLRHYLHVSNTASGQLKTTANYRDFSAWYHIVYVWDSGNATAGDRQKFYVNGVEVTAFDTDANASLNQDSLLNTSGNTMQVGVSNTDDSSSFFEGLMAHTHFCDGYAYAASDFGETDSTSGIWVAKTSPSVSYGNNGFFLKYEDTSNYGNDSSGNNNDLTMTGTITQTKDTPDNNFATWSTLYQPHTGVDATFSNGNTTCISQNGTGDYWGSASTLGMMSGNWYAEFKAVTASNKPSFGIVQAPALHQYHEVWIGNLLYDYSYVADGTTYHNNQLGSGTWNTFTTGDIIGVAVDLDNNKIYFSKNGTWENSGDPTSGATGTGSAFTITSIAASTGGSESGGAYHFACSDQSTGGDTMAANFGNGYFQTTAISSGNADDAGEGDFEYDVPAGYYALCTNNIATYG